MTKTQLQNAANQTAKELTASGEAFTNSMMGKGLKPLISAIIRYIRITNMRLTNLEGGADGK